MLNLGVTGDVPLDVFNDGLARPKRAPAQSQVHGTPLSPETLSNPEFGTVVPFQESMRCAPPVFDAVRCVHEFAQIPFLE